MSAIAIKRSIFKTKYLYNKNSAFKVYRPLGYTTTKTVFTDDGKFNTMLYLIYNIENIKNYKVIDMVKEKGFSILIKEGVKPIILDGTVLDIEETLLSVKIKTRSFIGSNNLVILNKNFTVKKTRYFNYLGIGKRIAALYSFVSILLLSNILIKLRDSKLSIFNGCAFSDIEIPNIVNEYEFTEVNTLVYDVNKPNLIKTGG